MPILAKFVPLIADCQKMTNGFLESMTNRMFDNSDAALLDFAEKAESNIAQSRFFEAMNEIRRKRQQFETSFYQEINLSFESFAALEKENPHQDPSPFKTLSLVDAEEQEEDVAIKNALSKLQRNIHEEVFALRQRLAVINNCIPIPEKDLPGGPSVIAEAFREATKSLEMDTKAKLVILALFDKFVLSETAVIYSEMNQKLLSADILPNLKYEIKKSEGGYSVPLRKQANSHASSKDQIINRAALGEELFGNICQLLSKRSESIEDDKNNQGTFPEEIFPEIESAALHPVLYDSIGKVQRETLQSTQSETVAANVTKQKLAANTLIENIEIDDTLIDVLHQTIIEEKEKVFGGIDRRNIPTADSNSIELVGMIFEFMLKEKELPSIAKASLSRLHTPFLKLSILDRSFFTQEEHPARKLLDAMISAGIRWIDTQNLNEGIYPELTSTVEKILAEFENEVLIFESCHKAFEDSVSRLVEKSNILERRTNEAANGQEKLLSARDLSQREIHSLIAGKTIAKPAFNLLNKLWADKLTFMMLRDITADESPAWTTARSLASEIILSTQLPASVDDRQYRISTIKGFQQEIRDALKTVHHAEKEALLQALFNYHNKILEPETSPSTHDVIKTDPASVIHQTHKNLSEKEQTALDQVENLPFGTWFDFHDKVTAKVLRAKLSWRSEITGKVMFVDAMGLKAAVIAKTDLAREIAEGSVLIVTRNKAPFVDRALSAAHKSLENDLVTPA